MNFIFQMNLFVIMYKKSFAQMTENILFIKKGSMNKFHASVLYNSHEFEISFHAIYISRVILYL